MTDEENPKSEETGKASLTIDPKEQMRRDIRKRHRNYLVGFLVMVFFILLISFLAFRQPRITWRKFLLEDEKDENGNNVYTVYMQYKNTNWYPIHFGKMKTPLISYGAVGSGQSGTTVGECTFDAFECQKRVSTFYPAKCMRTCTLDYTYDSAVQADFETYVEDACSKGEGANLYMAGKSTASNGPSSFNVQMSDSYYYAC